MRQVSDSAHLLCRFPFSLFLNDRAKTFNYCVEETITYLKMIFFLRIPWGTRPDNLLFCTYLQLCISIRIKVWRFSESTTKVIVSWMNTVKSIWNKTKILPNTREHNSSNTPGYWTYSSFRLGRSAKVEGNAPLNSLFSRWLEYIKINLFQYTNMLHVTTKDKLLHILQICASIKIRYLASQWISIKISALEVRFAIIRGRSKLELKIMNL